MLLTSLIENVRRKLAQLLAASVLGVILSLVLSPLQAKAEATAFSSTPSSSLYQSSTSSASNKMVYSLRGNSALFPDEVPYTDAVLRLALNKTKTDFGDFEIEKVAKMNLPRAINAMSLNTYNNLLVLMNYEDRYGATTGLTYIPIPVEFGLNGYRVCFSNKNTTHKLKAVSTLDQLKQFSIIQGLGWPDNSILRANGFNVLEIADSDPESLIKMLAGGRGDLFCRGLGEYIKEYKVFKQYIDFDLDQSMYLHYPMARFFFLNAQNKVAAQRLRVGIERALADGSLKQLWTDYYKPSIDAAKLKTRKKFELSSPHLNHFDKSYSRYLVDLTK